MVAESKIKGTVQEIDIRKLWTDYKSKDNVYYLNGLQTEIELRPTECIRDDGFVGSIVEHVKTLLKESGFHYTDEYVFRDCKVNPIWKQSNVSGGMYWSRPFSEDDTKLTQLILMYVSSGDPILDITYRGHEEAHAVESFDRLDFIENLVNQTIGKSIKLQGVHPEIIGQIGGLIALERRKIDPLEQENSIFKGYEGTSRTYMEWMKTAMDILYSK